MDELVSVIKVAQISAEGSELKTTFTRVHMPSSMSPEVVTVDVVHRTIRKAGVLPLGVKIALYYKDEEGDFVTLPNPKQAWPRCCISDDLLRAWFRYVPAPPGTAPSTPPCTCLGPHKHMPDKNKLNKVDYDGFKGYSMLAAASDACASCVQHWLDLGVNPNFSSTNQEYTALDCVFWAEKKSQVSRASAEQVKELLRDAGGFANYK